MARQFIIWFLATIIASVAATAAIGAITKSKRPHWALQLWPTNAFAYAKLADVAIISAITANKGQLPKEIDERTVEWARRSIRGEPTSAEGLRTLALAADVRGQEERARNLMRLARQLNTRDLIAGLWLIEDYAQAGEYEPALITYDEALRSLAPEQRGLLLTAMVGALSDPVLLAPYYELLRKSPPWAPAFWRQAAQTAPALPNAARLRLRLAEDGVGLPEENEVLLLNGLIGQKQFAAAYQIYDILSASGQSASWIRNGDFSETPRFPPFDWTLISSGDLGAGVNERSGQLEISAIGNAHGLVAEQLVRLDPGSYRLVARASGPDSRGSGSPLSATFACAEGETEPRRFDVPKNGASQTVVVATSGCSFYWLKLLVDAREQEDDFELALDQLSLQKL